MNRLLELIFGLMRSAFRWRAAARTSTAGNACQVALATVIGRLEELNRATERDFLAVGERLIQFRSVAREISTEIAGLHALISGEHGRQTSEALTGMLEAFRGTDARIGERGRALAGVGDLSRRVRLAFARLHETVPMFQALCTLTRIETARLAGGGEGLSNLAEEVAPLSETIQSTAESVFAGASRLGASVDAALRKVSAICGRQLRELPSMIASVTDSLRKLTDRQRQAGETSSREASGTSEIGEAIGHLVSSIQFHDITRQQIEHVAQALSALHSAFKSRDGNTVPPQARVVLSLQSSQLVSAEQSFTRAMGKIEHDLEHIRSRIVEMADDCRSLLGLEDNQQSFFARMETALSAILEAVASAGAAEKELACIAAGLVTTIGEMRQAVAEICGVEIRIERTATNATIRAAHLGETGGALDVIAGGIGLLARESNLNTEDASQALDLMSDAARRVSGGASLTESGHAERVRRAVIEFHSSTESSAARVLRIVDLSSNLAENIGEILGGFSAGRLLKETVDWARAELARIDAKMIGAESASAVFEGAPDSSSALHDFSKRYTMQTEREVHQSVVSGVVAGGVTGMAEAVTAADGLGDNVELF